MKSIFELLYVNAVLLEILFGLNDGLFFAREYHAKFAQRRPLNEVDVAEDNVGPYLKTLVKRNNKRFACRTSGIGQKQNLAAVGHLGIQLAAFDKPQEVFLRCWPY